MGDAHIGEHSNIGAATIFANYDGMAKHHTTVGSHAFTGSDTFLVAPLTIGDGAYTAAGSVITEDVPPGIAVAEGVHSLQQGNARNVNGLTSQRLADTGGGSTFYDNRIDVRAA